jgi:hypothetical protein
MWLGRDHDRRPPFSIDGANERHRVDPMVELYSPGADQPGPRGPACRIEEVPDPVDELDVGAWTRFRVSVELEELHPVAPLGPITNSDLPHRWFLSVQGTEDAECR